MNGCIENKWMERWMGEWEDEEECMDRQTGGG